MPVVIPQDRFLRFDELASLLHAVAAEAPGICAVESIGRSNEGRDIWLTTLTDGSTGSHDRKPALWVDANIHATEVTGSVAALALIGRLVNGYGNDAKVTRALQTRTFYVVCRINPDGAELALADDPRYLRSSTRPWPWTDGHRAQGLHLSDIDGDGRILTMRVADDRGAWKVHPDDDRIHIARQPDDGPDDGPFYRLLDEGLIEGYDGTLIGRPANPEGLDLNRNFPAGWATSVTGSGDYPGSEPEIAAVVAAVASRPNICGYNAFHTSGGVLLRPSSVKADSDLPPFDVWAWKQFGAKGTKLTGYPVSSVFEDFTWDKKRTMSGAADDWAYDHLGVFSWTTEFWDVVRHATGEGSANDAWTFGPTSDQELAVLRWADINVPDAYVAWRPFEHPQLGAIELGGWDSMWLWSNPPRHLLAAEVAPHADFAVYLALASPALDVVECSAHVLGPELWKVRVVVANVGWLPTTVTEHGSGRLLPLVAEVILPDGAELASVDARIELGQLAGMSAARFGDVARNDGTPERARAEWIVRAPAGTELRVVASHPRAGTAETTLVLRS